MGFGGYAIDEEMFAFIKSILPAGSTILELGSGEGTAELVKHYKVYSIEDDPRWLNKYHNNYIHAPISWHKPVQRFDGEKWYDSEVLKRRLPQIKYDLLIVDGPSRERAQRVGFIKYWSLFRHDVPIIFDDINRNPEYRIAIKTAARLRTTITIHNAWKGKQFGVIVP